MDSRADRLEPSDSNIHRGRTFVHSQLELKHRMALLPLYALSDKETSAVTKIKAIRAPRARVYHARWGVQGRNAKPGVLHHKVGKSAALLVRSH